MDSCIVSSKLILQEYCESYLQKMLFNNILQISCRNSTKIVYFYNHGIFAFKSPWKKDDAGKVWNVFSPFVSKEVSWRVPIL